MKSKQSFKPVLGIWKDKHLRYGLNGDIDSKGQVLQDRLLTSFVSTVEMKSFVINKIL